MTARSSDWLALAATMVASALATVVLAGLLNFPGVCVPEVTNCGEGRRNASFVVLGLGAAWLAYLVARFIRKFR